MPTLRLPALIAALVSAVTAATAATAVHAQPAPPAGPAAGASTPSRMEPLRGPEACERLWREYAQSQACFNRFRVVGGGLKPEAFERCGQPLPDPAAVCGVRR